MSVNLYNSERYHDPTAFAALTALEQEAKQKGYNSLVYICSPFSGSISANMSKARSYCRFAVESGFIPIAPHLLFPQFMNDSDPQERNIAMFMDIMLLTKCSELWVFGDRISKGMNVEVAKAKRNQIPIRHFTEKCEEVFSR